jgi:catechol 2,3-dioxygenase
MNARLPDDLRFGGMALAVADLARSIDYYRRRFGMEMLEQEKQRAALGAGGRRLLELEERPGAKRDPDAADLFHFALRVPSRPALARQLARLLATDTRLTGASDHSVSEALYLRDPDGHGIEISRDRPRATWYRNGRVHMGTTALDLDDLLKEAPASAGDQDGLDPDTVIGHVHLETCDLDRSKDFYVDRLGFAVTAERPGASFMSKGGYHRAWPRWRRIWARRPPLRDRWPSATRTGWRSGSSRQHEVPARRALGCRRAGGAARLKPGAVRRDRLAGPRGRPLELDR